MRRTNGARSYGPRTSSRSSGPAPLSLIEGAVVGAGRSAPPPHRVGDRHDALEFAPLALLRDHQVIKPAETALRAERELIERQKPARLVDTPSQEVERLEIRPFCCHQPQHRHRALAHMRQ